MKRTKKILLDTPILGNNLKKSSQLFHLRSDVQSMKTRSDQTSWLLEELSNKQNTSNAVYENKYQELAETMEELSKSLLHLSDRLDNALRDTGSHLKSASTPEGTTMLLADNHELDKFYIDFENKFRGNEDLIEERLLVYKKYFLEASPSFFKDAPALDLGCGRGEMLSMLQKYKINSLGIDLNEEMVKRANDRGQKAIQANAIDYLKKQKTNSVGAITGFHLIEHIPFEALIELFNQCRRVLKKGGFIIFETPNPENLSVATLQFFYDPSHLKPLPPDLTKFVAESAGFKNVEILRLHPAQEESETGFISEAEKRLNTFQDYSVIGYKL